MLGRTSQVLCSHLLTFPENKREICYWKFWLLLQTLQGIRIEQMELLTYISRGVDITKTLSWPHLYAAPVAIVWNDTDIWRCDTYSDVRIEVCVSNVAHLAMKNRNTAVKWVSDFLRRRGVDPFLHERVKQTVSREIQIFACFWRFWKSNRFPNICFQDFQTNFHLKKASLLKLC